MPPIIKVEHISKQYRLGQVGTGSIKDDLKRYWYRLRGKEDPFLKIGDTNDRSSKGNSDYVWALQDISFEVQPGEVLGIIGRNGAGKSTLLKILSRVTEPTMGRIEMHGRVASLLEVGTGMHPDLTGRENIYLNGAILGMTKKEINSKLDEIIDFSGVERYIDTPVKRYSSGMHVRLGFAVAAHLEPEILIVDEVLAVGDAEFQKKCLGKMKDVSTKEGRTVLFVSHNMGAINTLCNKALVMNNGILGFMGSVDAALEFYLHETKPINVSGYINTAPDASDIISVRVLNADSMLPVHSFKFDDEILLEFVIKLESKSSNARFGFRIRDQRERNVFTSEIDLGNFYRTPGDYTFYANIPSKLLTPNTYFPLVGLHKPNEEIFRYMEGPVSFQIEETGSDFNQYTGYDYGCVFVNCRWTLKPTLN